MNAAFARGSLAGLVTCVVVAACSASTTQPAGSVVPAVQPTVPMWVFPLSAPVPARPAVAGAAAPTAATPIAANAAPTDATLSAAPAPTSTATTAAADRNGAATAAGSPLIHLPDSTAAFTRPQLTNRFAAPDWYPSSHAPMPEVVARGRAPDLFACGYCHTPAGQGRPVVASLDLGNMIDAVAYAASLRP